LEILNLHKEKISIAALTIGLAGILEQIQGDWQFSFATEAVIAATGLKGPDLKIKTIEIAPAMVGILSKNKITLDLQPEWRVRMSDIQPGSLTVSATELQPEQNKNIHISVALNSGLAWNIAPSRWQWTIKNIQQHDISLKPSPISINIEQLAGTQKNLQLKADLASQHISLMSKENGLVIENIRTELTADAGKITGTASFSPETVPGTLAIRFSYDLKNGRGQATVNSEQPFSFSEITPLSSLLDQWPTAFDLTGGQLQLKSSLSRQPGQPLQATLQAELTKGKGSYKEILFSGLAVRQNLQLLPTIQSRNDGRITIDTVETGITVKDVTLKTVFTPSPHGRLPKITVRKLSASLFGGTVSDDFLIYDPQQPEVLSTVRLNNIDLAQLITVQQVKGLEVQGEIAGSLPVFFDHNGLRIDGGELKNTGTGGLIRYTLAGNNGLKEFPLTGYALKALEEFHYNLLSATVKYTPDGELQLGLHLEGKSPRLDTNRPVHLNINTEQNLLSLLKSLRYSTSLTDEIDKEVQQQYQN
ncbi:MAG: YdbH domain-containing protein, partial [Desulfobulbaceae bacterium]|nr:YdbH domain-containing protein [Desulfobulbaceae bacterium]